MPTTGTVKPVLPNRRVSMVATTIASPAAVAYAPLPVQPAA
jgi:hypothetical protein